MLRRIVPLALLSVLVFGCQPPSQVDQRPRRPKRYSAIVSLSPGATEMLLSLGETPAVKGLTAADNWPVGTVRNFPVVASVKPDYEKLQSIKPDLIVYDASLYSDQDVAKLKGLGADMFAISGSTVHEFVKQVYELGSLTGNEKNFNDYANKIMAERDAASSSPLNPMPKVAILMPGEAGGDYISGTQSFLGDSLKIIGAEPVGPAVDRFVQIGAEGIVALNPDVIVVPGTKTNLRGAELVMKDPKLQSVKAVRDGNVRVVDQDILLRRGGRVDRMLHALREVVGGGK